MNKRGNLLFVFSLLLIVLFSCLASAGTLQVTTEHPFLVDGEWVSASSLEIGDELTLINGSKVKITSITEKIFEDNFLVYNLEASEYSDFVVNSEGLDVVVHNSESSNEIIDSWWLTKPGDKFSVSVGPVGSGNKEIYRVSQHAASNMKPPWALQPILKNGQPVFSRGRIMYIESKGIPKPMVESILENPTKIYPGDKPGTLIYEGGFFKKIGKFESPVQVVVNPNSKTIITVLANRANILP